MNHVTAIVNTERYSSNYSTVLATTVLFPVEPVNPDESHFWDVSSDHG